MHTASLNALIEAIFVGRTHYGSVFDIPASRFYAPPFSPDAFEVLSERCALPVGPAAGPHTHLAQSIASAWLTGGRVIELKTVQVLDELDIDKPCIDAADVGFNTEWSTELRIDEALEEYTKAWILVHLLAALEGTAARASADPGVIFTMSVGYDLDGIRSERVDRFIEVMRGAADNPVFDRLKSEAREALTAFVPEAGPYAGLREAALTALEEVGPPSCRSVTLSTMHGCPPDEIEAIASRLLAEKGLDTTVKLNPTLLGFDDVSAILSENGYRYSLSRADFEADLGYTEALSLVDRLRSQAAALGRGFAVKLSNTLPVANDRGVLPGESAYVSGRPLFPLTTTLAARLAEDLPHPVPFSYSAGATAENTGELLHAGLAPVTLSTELLKPGGYLRLADVARRAAEALAGGAPALLPAGRDAADTPASRPTPLPDPERLSELVSRRRRGGDVRARRGAVTAYVPGALPLTDCFIAPCTEACPISQDVPGYIEAAAAGDCAEAMRRIRATNPFPELTAALCDQRCAKACTRLEYEGPVQIRKMKGIAVRCASAAAEGPPAAETPEPRRPAAAPGPAHSAHSAAQPEPRPRVAVLEPGIEAMSAAYDLARAGAEVTVAEAIETVEERIAAELSAYRVPDGGIAADLQGIRAAGVHFAAVAAATRDGAPADTGATAEMVIRGGSTQPDPSQPDPSRGRPKIIDLIATGKREAARRMPEAGLGSTAGPVAPRPGAPDPLAGPPEAGRPDTERLAAIFEKQGLRIRPGRGSAAEVAATEAARCLECNTICLKCVQVCPNRANTAVAVQPEDGLADAFQVVHIDAWCNECGNCATFCPYEAAPYREKFTVFSSRTRFRASAAPGVVRAADRLEVRESYGGETTVASMASITSVSQPGASAPGVWTLLRRIVLSYPHLLGEAEDADL
jgi:putative selenate reductase